MSPHQDPAIIDDEQAFAVPVRPNDETHAQGCDCEWCWLGVTTATHITDAARDRRGLIVVGLLFALILFSYGAMA